jgi:hypothetical protein
MFDHKALPHLTRFQNRIQSKGGNDQEELQSDVRMQRHALFFAVVKLMIKEKLNDGDVPATNISFRTLFSVLNLYGSCVDSISYLTNAEPGVWSCEVVGVYFQSPYPPGTDDE